MLINTSARLEYFLTSWTRITIRCFYRRINTSTTILMLLCQYMTLIITFTSSYEIARFTTIYTRMVHQNEGYIIDLDKKLAKRILVHFCPFLARSAEGLQPSTPFMPKNYQSQVFRLKTTNKSISVTNPFFRVFAFCVLKVSRANGKMDIFWTGYKSPNISPRPHHNFHHIHITIPYYGKDVYLPVEVHPTPNAIGIPPKPYINFSI